MKLKRRFFILIIVTFALLSVLLLYFIVNHKKPNHNLVELSLLRYDKDLFSLDVNHLAQGVAQLAEKYPPTIIEPDIWNDAARMNELKAYLQDTVIIALYKEAEKAVDFDVILKELQKAFGYYKMYYPDDSIPVMVTMVPGLDFSMPSVYIYDNFLFVNVDMYLGADNPYYQAAGLPSYIAERCDKVYLPVDIFKKAIVYKHLAKAPRNTLLEAMITEGKKLFFTEMMYPFVHERFIIGYSEEKQEWATQYLGNAWNYMIEKNELFGKGESLMRCYIEEAPFTKPFGNESPGRMGAFLGWKLIQSYMTNNPEVTLQNLMQETDYQKILNSAKFKPQRR